MCTMGIISSREWKKDRQHNGQKKKWQKYKQWSTKYYTKKLKIEHHEPPDKWGETDVIRKS